MAPRKCESGTFCLENLTLGLFLVLFILLAFLYYIFLTKPVGHPYIYPMPMSMPMSMPISSINPIASMSTTPNVMMDPYAPPVRTDGMYFPTRSQGVPVNIETRGLQSDYTQMGIITSEHKENMILPLMGRRLMTGVDKWQYYTISNTGSINTKLPIRYRGRGCSGEYGCDCLMNGDVVYVEGYQDTFRVTLYETAKFQYIPYI